MMDQFLQLSPKNYPQNTSDILKNTQSLRHTDYNPKVAQQNECLSQNQKNQNKFIRDDIYLIKMQVQKIIFYDIPNKSLPDEENASQIRNSNPSIQRNEKEGEFKIKMTQSSPFYLTQKVYKQNYDKYFQQKSSFEISKLMPIKQIKEKSNNTNSKNQGYNLSSNEARLLRQEFSQMNNNKKLLKQTTHRKVKKLSRISNNSLPQIRIIQKSQVEQNYQLSYKRSQQRGALLFQGKDLAPKTKEQLTDIIRHTFPYEQKKFLNQIINQNSSFMFTANEEGYIQLQLNEQTFEGQKITGNIFWGKFPLKPFLEIPFTNHQIDFKLRRVNKMSQPKPLEQVKKKPKRFQHKQQINRFPCQIMFKLFCVPGDTKYWGRINITDVSINSLVWEHLNYNNQRSCVCLKFQFPDVIENNRITCRNQISQILSKVISFEPDQNLVWDDDFSISINSKRNRLSIKLIQMQDNRMIQSSIIGQNQINLLEAGFLFDGITTAKHTILNFPDKNRDKKEGSKIADLNIQFTFQMNKQYLQTQQNNYSKNQNSFIQTGFTS